MSKISNFLLILLIFFTPYLLASQDTLYIDGTGKQVLERLSTVSDSTRTVDLVIFLLQPLSHFDSTGKHFEQRLYLHHHGFDRPVVFDTEGYAAGHARIGELTHLLDANQIIAEHRFFGTSVPDSLDWRYLNIRESAADHHRIVDIFRKMYKGKWITTGISKGGQTAMYHRRFYPDDVDATVCYVAPLNFSYREPRIREFLKRVGTDTCRSRLLRLQRELLERQQELIPAFAEVTAKKEYTFSIGLNTAYEYSVLELPFSFWQWKPVVCDNLPAEGLPADSLIKKFVALVSPFYFSDRGIRYYTPFFYQALTEIGYYDYDLSPFPGLITSITDPTYMFNAPSETSPVFNPAVMQDIATWIRRDAKRMIFIYGGDDPWGASAVELGDNRDCLKVVLPGGSHATRMSSFSRALRDSICTRLGAWLDISIDPD